MAVGCRPAAAVVFMDCFLTDACCFYQGHAAVNTLGMGVATSPSGEISSANAAETAALLPSKLKQLLALPASDTNATDALTSVGSGCRRSDYLEPPLSAARSVNEWASRSRRSSETVRGSSSGGFGAADSAAGCAGVSARQGCAFPAASTRRIVGACCIGASRGWSNWESCCLNAQPESSRPHIWSGRLSTTAADWCRQ